MNCHVQVLKDDARLALVRESAATGEPIPWVQIHKMPDYVYFNHSVHVNRGVSCVECHGQINRMDEVYHAKPLSMSYCLTAIATRRCGCVRWTRSPIWTGSVLRADQQLETGHENHVKNGMCNRCKTARPVTDEKFHPHPNKPARPIGAVWTNWRTRRSSANGWRRSFPPGASEFFDPVTRRNFVKIMSASFLLAGLGATGCRRPVENIYPFAKMPENYVHGVPQFFATAMPSRRERGAAGGEIQRRAAHQSGGQSRTIPTATGARTRLRRRRC